MLKKFIKGAGCTALVFALFSLYTAHRIPDCLYYGSNGEVKVQSLPMVTFVTKTEGESLAAAAGTGNINYTAKLFGLFDIKQVTATPQSERRVAVAGTPFGIKMFSDGAMVVGFSQINTANGPVCPAQKGGMQEGDIITEINGIKANSNSRVEGIISAAGGSTLNISFVRSGTQHTAAVTPVMEKESGQWRTGMWIRDSSAGVGTMTFYDVQQNTFAGLGHGIKDTDTQKDIPLLSGEIVPVKIIGVTKSQRGSPGELKGVFTSDIAVGEILANDENGVYGRVFSAPRDNMMETALPQEIQTGRAYILTTTDGTKPQKYEIAIEKISLTATNKSRNMVIRITDPKLLEITGGIVQGMGVIDNRDNTEKPGNTGFFAVTLSNDPTTGV